MSMKDGNGKLRKDQTDHYGRVLGGGGGGVSPEDFVDTDTIEFSQPEGQPKKIQADLTDAVAEILNNAITPAKLEDTDSVQIARDSETGKTSAHVVRYDASSADKELLKFYKCTQAQYDAIATKDVDTLYIVVG